MSEQRKPGKPALKGTNAIEQAEPRDGEKLEREPMLSVTTVDGKTYITGEIDLDQLASEADEAVAKGFTKLRDFAEYDAQEALLDAICQAHDIMERMGLKDSDLARRMNVSPSYVSRLMNATPNLTVVSLAKLAKALGGKIRINIVIDNQPPPGKD